MSILDEIERLSGRTLFDYQRLAILRAEAMTQAGQRTCLYYKTGAGKTLTSLGQMLAWGERRVLVIAPPATHSQWTSLGEKLGMDVGVMSHAKFRMPDTLLSRSQAVIADEMHLFGGHDGKGWKKLDRVALHLKAPMVTMSATPNYNDAERVYCVAHILDPHAHKGGYLEFLYRHCVTEQNPFGQMPLVTGFQRHPDAASFLASLPGVSYLPDDLVFTISDVPIPELQDPQLDAFGYNRRAHRIVASAMEERHLRTFQAMVNDQGLVHDHVYRVITKVLSRATTPVLVFCAHSTIAEALQSTLLADGVDSLVVTGDLTLTQKRKRLDLFMQGRANVLVGTATLATGTDGLDKVCDWLIIADDTEDDSLRRQLIGRIMPRGMDADVLKKKVYRLVQQ